MNISDITSLLGWSALINYIILLVWFFLFSLGHDFIYNLHGRWFNMRLDTFDAIHYGLMGIYKLLILLFALLPWLILTIIL